MKFKYLIKEHTYLSTFKSCSTSPPPSAKNRVCKQFFRWAKRRDPSVNEHDFEKVYSIYFWDPIIRKPSKTTCYSTMGSIHGWCGTCYPGELNPGEEGYCDKYDEGNEKDIEVEAIYALLSGMSPAMVMVRVTAVRQPFEAVLRL